MNTPRFGLVLFLFGSVFATLAAAAPVHLRFTNPTDQMFIFRADSAQVPWNQTVASLEQLDIYYDAINPGPANNYWSIRVLSPIGGFRIQRPLENLSISPFAISFEYLNYSGPFEQFRFDASFSSPFSVDGSNPLLQPVIGPGGEYWKPVNWYIDAGSSFFPVPHFAEGYGLGGFATVVALPEPSTYAAGALILLGVAVGWRRFRRAG